MQKTILLSILVASMTLVLVATGWADVPPPPVNQTIGMEDVAPSALEEADCRACHSSGVPDRHHMLYPTYTCLDCHGDTFTVVRDCIVCHTTSAHHTTSTAQGRNCVACHGDIVDNYDDGHYIPSYDPSLVTPTRSAGDGLPLNSRDKGAGGCNYCHDKDDLNPNVILNMKDLHHPVRDDANLACTVCHTEPRDTTQIRVCETCHGPDSLHNIQADSPNSDNVGTIVIGGEDAGYGHVGRDAGPGDSDCWGCHGFAMAFAPGSGPTIPTVYSSDTAVVNAGTDTVVVLSGSGFTNIAGDMQFESDVALTAADGSLATLTPDVTLQDALAVTIPSDTAPGNYRLQAVKADFASNPAVISVVPQVTITDVTFDRGIVTIRGSGFAGYAEGSGTSVTGTVRVGRPRGNRTRTVEGTIISWSDTTIEAYIRGRLKEVTVNSIFGTDTSEVGR